MFQVVEFGWPADLAMPLERLCSLCRLLEAWQRTHPQNVCALHALDGRGRLGLVVLAFRIYCSLSSAGCAQALCSVCTLFLSRSLLETLPCACESANVRPRSARIASEADFLHSNSYDCPVNTMQLAQMLSPHVLLM